MKDRRELLALLTHKVQHFAVAASDFHKITPQDIAHALGKMHSEAARYFARVKYCGQIEFAERCAELGQIAMLQEIEDIEKWRSRPYWVFDMCAMAIAEATHPQICPWCRGTAEIISQNLRIVCEACRGSGHKVWRASDRANLMGISRQNWSAWTERYKDIQVRTVDRYEDLLASALSKKMA